MDEIQLLDDERFDLVDIARMQTLVGEYMARALGGIVGFASGTLSSIAFDTANPAAVGIGECLLWRGVAAGTEGKLADGRVIRHDPTLPSQTSVVDLSAYVAGSGTPWLWARRIQVASDVETRRQWDVGGGVEASITPSTKLVERVAFEVGVDVPDADPGWFKFARVVDWSGGLPLIDPKHAWDPDSYDLETPLVGGAYHEWGRISQLFNLGLGNSPVTSLSEVLSMLVYVVTRMNDKLGNYPLTAAPSTGRGGLVQLEEAIDDTESDLADLAGRTDSCRVLAAGRVDWDGDVTYTWVGVGAKPSDGANPIVVTATRQSAGVVRLQAAPLVGAVIDIQSVLLTPHTNEAPLSNNLPCYIYAGRLDQENARVDVNIKSTGGAFAEQSFFVTLLGSFG
jgi:hypothetical protein